MVDAVEARQERGDLASVHAIERQLHPASIKDKAGYAARFKNPGRDDDTLSGLSDAHSSIFNNARHAPGKPWKQATEFPGSDRHVLCDHS